MLRIAICEKSKRQQSELLDYIARDVDIDDDYSTECFGSVIELKRRIDANDFNFDLLLLGIGSNGKDSIVLASYIREHKFDIDVIFLAETVDYITDAFRCKAFNYIVKPISFSKFTYEMKQYIKEKREYQRDYLSVSIQGKETMIPLNVVLYFTSNARKIGAFFINDNKEIWFYGKLDELEQNLLQYGFLRCHQSYLINAHMIEGVDSETVRTAGGNFAVSRKYSANVYKQWDSIKKSMYDSSGIATMRGRIPSDIHDINEDEWEDSTEIITKSYAAGNAKYGLLVGISGNWKNNSFRIYNNEETVLGRDEGQCQIVIWGTAISRKHCGIRFDEEKQCYFVFDYSKNGTIVGNFGHIEKNQWLRAERNTLVKLVDDKCSFMLM